MEASVLDLLPFVKELDKMLRRVMPETISLELAYQPASYLVHADPTRLQQALMNLALNARDAMPAGGMLRFELDRLLLFPGGVSPIADMPPGDWIRLVVEDTGEGIRPENLQHIFEPFFTTKPVGQGTGLGLAQVYGIIKQHNGFIDVESQAGKGTRFRIFLPAYAEAPTERNQVESANGYDGSGKTVLVVEDDGVTREALNALLEAYNYRVLTAINGVEALQVMENSERPADLVVSDVVMPKMGGVSLYHILKERWPQVKVLFITGHPLESESQMILEKGSVHWLQKPFSVQDFHRAIQVLMASTGTRD
jgi:CheY-like chemotaxis protein